MSSNLISPASPLSSPPFPTPEPSRLHMSRSGSTTTPSPPSKPKARAPPPASVVATHNNLPFGSYGFTGFTSIEVRDLDEAEEFYSPVFGWEFQPEPKGRRAPAGRGETGKMSRVFTVPGAPVAGVIHLEMPEEKEEVGGGEGKRKGTGKSDGERVNKVTGKPLAKPVEDPVRPKLLDYIVVEDMAKTLNLAIRKGAQVLRDPYRMGSCELAEIEFEGVVHGIMARPEPDAESVMVAMGVQLHNM
ncbi:hypothetical protein GE09DRAFT_1209721 [Coniochaeta sp. 2T2.1]|nr:hypothetical protein GE09DRAFT_1209721 [Coniochaeta sp. 2T2.1]